MNKKSLMQGDGFISNLLEGASTLFIRKNKFPPKMRETLKEYGNNNIVKIIVGKSPVQSVITGIMNAMSFGQFRQNISKYNYDDVFHLYMLLHMDNGQILLTEKNEVVKLEKLKKNNKYSNNQSMNVNIPSSITLSTFFSNAVEGVGDSIYLYDHRNNNCQVYVNNLLKYNKLLTNAIKSFVLQPVEEILKDTPEYMNDIAKFVTNTAASFDRVLYGEGHYKTCKKCGKLVM